MTESGEFNNWFESIAEMPPRPWQSALARSTEYTNRFIRIPTGMGKTYGVVAAWSYHRLVRKDAAWPRRLVWCLPMRTLVEQTANAVENWLARLEPNGEGVPVHVLMGGVAARNWHLDPEREAVLIGTQDMLISRALNRGYGSPRGRWPMEFAQLHKDALWVLDEVQLMDVSLTTSAQLQAFREYHPAGMSSARPARSWWMSATLQPEWIETRDFTPTAKLLQGAATTLGTQDRDAAIYSTNKTLEVETVPQKSDRNCSNWANLVQEAHEQTRKGPWGRITLAIANTVDDAVALFRVLHKRIGKDAGSPEIRLAHSRFRPLERQAWRKDFLSRDACSADVDRIVISTQVVEAGVDISAATLVTQLAPWPNLVQRFGRAGRYGGESRVVVVNRELDERSALPYTADGLEAASEALAQLSDGSAASIDALEEALREEDNDLLGRLYSHAKPLTITPREFSELFDTGPDLTGADLDISRFIRSGEERDLLVWWWSCAEGEPDPALQPTTDALCPVPALKAKEWLCQSGRLKDGCLAWVWDYLDGRWRRASPRDLYPGRTVLVDLAWGGYESELGWTGKASGGDIVVEGTRAIPKADLLADLAQDTESLSESTYKTVATHGCEVADTIVALTKTLGDRDSLLPVLDLAGRLHDLGKTHPTFQQAISKEKRAPEVVERQDLAKAPNEVWRHGRHIFGSRRGFRHELASALALFELLWQNAPLHDGLLGDLEGYVDAGILEAEASEPSNEQGSSLATELVALSALEFDLLAYLICCHHGKIRASWQSTPMDLENLSVVDGHVPMRGILEGDRLPAVAVLSASREISNVSEVELRLTPAELGLSARYGRSWRERMARLRHHFGDLELAYLETLLRTADVRASRLATPDPLLMEHKS